MTTKTAIKLAGGPLDGVVMPAASHPGSAVPIRLPLTIRDWSCKLDDDGPMPSGEFFDLASQPKFSKKWAVYVPTGKSGVYSFHRTEKA